MFEIPINVKLILLSFKTKSLYLLLSAKPVKGLFHGLWNILHRGSRYLSCIRCIEGKQVFRKDLLGFCLSFNFVKSSTCPNAQISLEDVFPVNFTIRSLFTCQDLKRSCTISFDKICLKSSFSI